MATLDQLPAEQRAIVELVVQRGRSYGALADVLQVPAERVRELARDALTELSPRTAARVEADWRGQVADYLLGQQDADEARSTRDYLKRSETARAWALSLLDSLDPLYPNGASPAVPEPGTGATAEAVPEVKPEPERQAITAEERIRERARKQPAVADEKKEPEPEAVKPEPKREPGTLSPEAQSALRRRRTIGLVAGLAVLAAIVVGILALAGVFSSDKKSSSSTAGTPATTTPAGSTTTSTTAQQPIQVLGQIVLHTVGTSKAQGIAYLVQQGPNKFVVVQAQVPPLPNNQKVAAYEVWLYNSNSNARSLGAQYTNAQGILQGRAPLPVDYQKFKSIDISRELFADRNAGHGKDSLLRGDFSTLAPVPQQQPGAGTTTTPAP
jgi:hypothetical protein